MSAAPRNAYQRILELTPRVEEIMGRLKQPMDEELPKIADRFYVRLERHPEALAVFHGGREQLVRQRIALAGWLSELFVPPYDESYAEKRMRVGIVHLNSGVDEHLMIGAMNWLREELIRGLGRITLPKGLTISETATALQKVLDLDLGIILSSYWTDLRSRTRNIDRLALIGQFSAAINHELRNPLGVISTSTYLLKSKLANEASEDVKSHLEKIERSVARANAIVSGLMRLLKVEEPARDSVDLESFLKSVIEEVPHPPGVTIELIPGAVSGRAAFDQDQVRQAVSNLIRNATEAIGEEGRVEVRFASDSIATSISVSDDGPGIPATTLNRIFEPLFTTKSFGTGLGLTLSKAIVEAHGGELKARCGLVGCTFEIRLPHFLIGRPAVPRSQPSS